MDYRKYTENNKVENTYKHMHEKQTLVFVKDMIKKYKEFPSKFLNVWESFLLLDKVIDESDPDNDLPQIIHAYQTAESIKNRYMNGDDLELVSIKSLFNATEWNNIPENIRNIYIEKICISKLYPYITDWGFFPLIGLIHDLGKVLLLKEFGGEQFFVVGDTFPVGCKFDSKNVYYEKGFYLSNKDLCCDDIYAKNCGFDNVLFSFGHDQYLYMKLSECKHNLPKEALYLIRYHSFYPWHKHRSYSHLADINDWLLLPLLKLFQKSDLYSKTREYPNFKDIENKYKSLVDKYIKGPIF